MISSKIQKFILGFHKRIGIKETQDHRNTAVLQTDQHMSAALPNRFTGSQDENVVSDQTDRQKYVQLSAQYASSLEQVWSVTSLLRIWTVRFRFLVTFGCFEFEII